MHTALVIVGGPRPVLTTHSRAAVARQVDVVVAVDSGLHHADELDRVVDVVIGDMDSVDPDTLGAAERSGAVLRRFDTDKDESDLQLALEHLLELDVDAATVIGGLEGRLDHLLSNLAVLASPRFASIEIEAYFDGTRVLPVHGFGARRVEAVPGPTMSVLALGGPATVSETGVRWPLDRAYLDPHVSLGLSNQILGSAAELTVHDGHVVVVLSEQEQR